MKRATATEAIQERARILEGARAIGAEFQANMEAVLSEMAMVILSQCRKSAGQDNG